jgi:hypothetical protein
LVQDPRFTQITLPTGRTVPREVVLPLQIRQLVDSEIPHRYIGLSLYSRLLLIGT